MKRNAKRARMANILAALAFMLVVQPGPVRAVPMDDKGSLQGPSPVAGLSAALDTELRRGSWRKACGIATDALGHGEQNVDALGVFGMCAALRNDRAAADTGLRRLREAETAPAYYAPMTEGILQLRNGAAEKAERTFKSVMASRPADPLALYFSGEAQHQLKRDSQAIASFKAVLNGWPEHAPALTSAARLLAAPKASPQELKEAVAMTERAT